MKSTGKSKRFWHGMTAALSVLLVVAMGLYSAGTALESTINSLLGTSSTEVVESEDGEETTSVYYESDFETAEELIAYREEFNVTMVEEGAVLLKNENDALPLASDAAITLFGIGGVSPVYSGTTGGGTIGNTDQIVTITEAFTESGFSINMTVHDWYVDTGIPETCIVETTDVTTQTTSTEGPWDNEDRELATRANGVTEADASSAFDDWESSYASYGDAAIVFLCRAEGEGSDLEVGDLAISDEEQALIDEAEENFDTVIVVINSSAMIEIDSLKYDDQIDAILWVSELGTDGAYGLAHILNGEVSPSGHLADTMAVDSTSSPAAQNMGSYTYANADEEGLDSYGMYYLVEAEGIYIGYKYYETRYEDTVLGQGNADSTVGTFGSDGAWDYTSEVSYGFGYGLSYTTFEQTLDSVTVDLDEQLIVVTATVTNTGSVAGKDVVQVYAQSPYTDYDIENGVEKASVQLLGFDKTETLDPGESETLTIEIDMKYLASYDSNGAETYILDAGDYYFAIGNGAHEALNNILAAKGYTTADGMTDDGDADLTYMWTNDELDTTSFSTGYDGETLITNQFEEADYNYYNEGTVTYLSRSDWEATWPETYDDLIATDEMIPWLTEEQYEAGDSDTSDITTGSTETTYSLIELRGLDYDDELWEDLLDQITLDEMALLITDACEITNAVSSVSFEGATAKDGPIGLSVGFSTDESNVYYIDDTASEEVQNYNFATLATEPMLASSFNLELAYERGNINGEDSLWSGYTENWAPGANLHRTPYSGRNYEYFSEDSMLTNLMATQVVLGTQAKGAISGIKHFAGNDFETNRNGVSTFFTEQAFRENDLRAFEGAFCPDEGGAMGTMTAFNRIGIQQAAYCDALLTTVLRDEWGFQGYTITDFAFETLMYPYASLVAGTDAFDNMISDYSAINADALESDATLLAAAREATHRTLYAYVNSNAMNGVSSSATIVSVTPWWMTAIYVLIAVAAVGTVLSVVMFIRATVKDNKQKKKGA